MAKNMSECLEFAADWLEHHEFLQEGGFYWIANHRVIAACMIGAVKLCEPLSSNIIAKALGFEGDNVMMPVAAFKWSDDKKRTKQQVIERLREYAAKPENKAHVL